MQSRLDRLRAILASEAAALRSEAQRSRLAASSRNAHIDSMTGAKTPIGADGPEVAETCICLAVQRAGRAVGRRFDEAYRVLGLTNWQYSILATLNGVRPWSVGDLAASLGADRTTVTANLKPLERRALIAIVADKVDRRVRRVRLTKAGRDLLQQGAQHRAQADAAIAKLLSGVDRRAFLETLAILSAESAEQP